MTALNKQAIDFSQPLETESGESVKHICHDVIEYKCARVCVDIVTGIVYSSPYVGLKIRNKEANPRAKLREQIESAADAYWQFDNGWISDMKCGDLSHEYLLFAKEPKNVLALLDELEAAENNLIDSECHVAGLEESLRDKQALLEVLDNSLCELLPGTQYMDPPDGGSVTPLEQVRRMVAAYRNRIAELEARDEPKFVKCWSCKHDIEVLAIVDCDGYCPRCASPIDLDDEPYAGIGVKGE